MKIMEKTKQARVEPKGIHNKRSCYFTLLSQYQYLTRLRYKLFLLLSIHQQLLFCQAPTCLFLQAKEEQIAALGTENAILHLTTAQVWSNSDCDWM